MRLYLAGPEVFLPDAAAVGAAKSALCAAHGFEGIFPAEAGQTPPDGPLWWRLYRANEALIQSCDVVVANMTPFRGASADIGTALEMGIMRGLGRAVHGYANTSGRFGGRTLVQLGPQARRRADGTWEDAEGLAVEDFDLQDNLMLEGAIRASGGQLTLRDVALCTPDRWRDHTAFEACLRALKG